MCATKYLLHIDVFILLTTNKSVILSLTLTSMIMLTSYTILYEICINTHTVSLNNSLIIVHEITLNLSSKRVTKASNIPVLLGCGALSLGTCAWYDGLIIRGLNAHFDCGRTDQTFRHQSPSTVVTHCSRTETSILLPKPKKAVRYITIIFLSAGNIFYDEYVTFIGVGIGLIQIPCIFV